jgi:hypothetical protein
MRAFSSSIRTASAQIDRGCGNDWLHFWKAQPVVASMACEQLRWLNLVRADLLSLFLVAAANGIGGLWADYLLVFNLTLVEGSVQEGVSEKPLWPCCSILRL